MNLGQTAVCCSPTSPVATGVLNQPGETVTLHQQETKRENETVLSPELYLCLRVRTCDFMSVGS